MSPESSRTRQRAAEMSADSHAVVGPLQGYHHETYVFPLPDPVTGAPMRVKCREPRENLLWFDRRCFASEERLLRALQGRVVRIPELIEVEGLGFQRFIEGHTIGSRHGSGRALPPSMAEHIVDLFRQLAGITPQTLPVARQCRPEDRPEDGDTEGFLERLIRFAEERVYRDNLPEFQSLFDSLGVNDVSFKHLRKHVSGLTGRPFCLLHADLHRENFIVDAEGGLWTIDWELAMFGDPLYDLATHLYLTRYPEQQEREMTLRWCDAVERVRPGSARGWREDLPRLLDFKRAQSVFTDAIRTSQSLSTEGRVGHRHLRQVSSKLEAVLRAAAVPLGLDSLPGRQEIEAALRRHAGC